MRALSFLAVFILSSSVYADSENVRLSTNGLVFKPVKAAAGNASGGSTVPQTMSERQLGFRALDYDGDGFVSKAEAAGNSFATLGFDRADRNRDGKLSFAEYDSIGKPRAVRKKGDGGSASAGGTKKQKN